ncbi:hypothetical protein EZI54_18305 [Marinobacter halodurans]|uniref:Transposase n=1 Tax=Marinobacter halodurans TaxID=2528979 RepID=A0ABY1ZJS9_9GAMM|nr:hypothetical protein [Marinobacter halodurans]TBW50336.1 hypothetical protein EZI54_18305 [Marinobacter halodurans]
MVLENAGLNESELAEYCRRKGPYVEQIKAWRSGCEQANRAAKAVKTRAEREEERAARQRIRQLERELRHKDVVLAETACYVAWIYGPLIALA